MSALDTEWIGTDARTTVTRSARSGELSILLVEDSVRDAELVALTMEASGLACRIDRVEDREAFISALKTKRYDLVLSDFSLPSFDGNSALGIAHAERPDVPFIFVSGAIGEDVAIDALKRGATDYVLKNRLERLAPAVRRALSEADLREERKRMEEALWFLLDASNRLLSTLEMTAIRDAVVGLAVPRIADFSMLDLLSEHGLRRVAAAHADPAIAAALGGERRDVPIDGAELPEDPLARAVRTQSFELFETVDDAILARFDPERGDAEGLKQLDPRSLIVVPLVVRGSAIGVLTLGRGPVGPAYRSADVALAEDFARRAAIAFDNARLFEQAQGAVRDARRATQMRDELLAVVSHDLRNPLSTIVMSASMLSKFDGVPGRDDAARRRRLTQTIERSAERMTNLIRDLLDLASVEAGRLAMKRAPHALGALVDEAAEMLQPIAQQKSLALEVAVDAPGRMIDCDRERMLQVLSNVVGNAIKFTPAGGRIDVVAESSDAELVVRVVDTGNGIDPEHVEHVFDRYWQGRRGREGGVGLGLSIAKGIVEAHQGTITITSELGRGTTVSVVLPTAP